MIDIKQAPPSPSSEILANVYSQFGEDGLLAEIFRRIGTTNKQCFEVGAADGKWFSNSRRLIDEGWQAVLIEADERNWPELDKLDDPPRVNVVHGKAEPVGVNSLDGILSMCNFDEHPDLGVIDVDGQDYYLFNGLMQCKPRVMVVEYDSEADIAFVPDLNGQGQAGFAAICSVAVSRGYFNAYTTHTNGIFILNSEREKFYAAFAKPAALSISKIVDAGKMEVDEVRAHEKAHPVVAPMELCDCNAATPCPNGKVGSELRCTAAEKAAAIERNRVNAPVLATGKEQEIKIAAILSRPRFGLNVFFDCAAEALSPWNIPIQSAYGVFWGMTLERMMEENIAAGMDWLLTLDFDTLFAAKHVQLLIDALGQNPNIDAIAALQPRRGRPLPLAVRSDGAMPITGGPVQVRTAHFGLTILRCEAFKKLKKKPWFLDVPAPDGSWGEGRLDGDIHFWANWGDSGNSLYVHTGCLAGHVEEMASEFTPDGKHRHVYLSEWRKNNGHTIKTFE